MYDHKEVESEILKYWEKHKIFDKLRKKIKGKKPWSFIDGPITANNPMGVHHAWGRTYKDLYQRFKAMQGFDQRFQNGFDCQGLHVEVGVEKSLKFNSKKDIEKFGIANFSRECRKSVEKFAKIQTEQSIKLGQWMDWKNSYFTMSDENIETIWHFLKKCHQNGWLYKGTRVLPWCIRCGTSSSQHEMSDEGYAELIHPTVYIKTKIKGKENEYLLIWTTTEWTLSSNVAAAVNPDLYYAKIKKNNDIYYLSENTLNKLGKDYELIKKIKGEELVGLKYESFYPDFEVQKRIDHKVVPWKEVQAEEGTGIVHIAPSCGIEDYELAEKESLPIIKSALDEEGNYNDGFGWLSGKNVKEAKSVIIKDLEERGLLFKKEDYKHRYPICWRCKEELVFRLGSEWFISCNEIRPKMKEEASKVKWTPKHVNELMQDWLNNMGDWNISRKRYWGLPLMFFECECGNLEVIGSIKELKEKAIDPKKVDKLPELHRPWIDEIKIRCSKCKKEIERIKEIGDCWLDAGIVPFSTLNYFEDKKYWKNWFPANLIIEMRAQVRLWFYSLLFMAVTLENKAPYKNVFAYEEVRDEKGEVMHKSKGNAIWFDDAVEKMGADIMRLIYISHKPQFNLNFGYTIAKEAEKPIKVIWNLGNYVQIYSKFNKKQKSLEAKDIVSKWIISRRENTKKLATQYLEELKPNKAIEIIMNFLLEDLSRTYGHFIREDLENKKEIQITLHKSFLEGLTLLSPFLPFITEKIYQDIYKHKKSIFLENWPKYNQKLIDKKLEENFERIKLIIQDILAEREKIKLGIRWPLNSVIITTKNSNSLKQFMNIIKTQTNIKEIILKEGENHISLDTKLTPALESEGFARELTRRIQDLRKKSKLKKENKIELCIALDDSKLLENFKAEIQKKTGSISINITTKFDKLYIYKDKITIRNKQFELGFNPK